MDIPRGGSSCPLFPGRTGLWNVSFRDGGKPEDPGKNPRSKDENQQQTQITCETRSRNGTQATADGRQAFLPLRQPRSQ